MHENSIAITAKLGRFDRHVAVALEELESENILTRIWEHDHTVWNPDPDEISNRLGWLHSPDVMKELIRMIFDLVTSLRSEGYEEAILLGMGGSSLAPDLFQKVFGTKDGYLNLRILDSTDPEAVQEIRDSIHIEKTVFIVATKSGGTVETLSFFKYFYNEVMEAMGEPLAGSHFIVITDPGSSLEGLAKRFSFREVFLNDPNIGGRYSALSYFGLVPAGFIGMDLAELLSRAQSVAKPSKSTNNDPGLLLGATLGELAKIGRDKLTIVTSPGLSSFGDWIEQLIAESTGKEGQGILPVVHEPRAEADVYGEDRVFVFLHLDGEDDFESVIKDLEDRGHPSVTIEIRDPYDLGAQFFIWEMATAIASQRLGINPFDQPNVEAAKVLARKKVREYEEHGALTEESPDVIGDGIEIYLSKDHKTGLASLSPQSAFNDFLASGVEDGYVSLQAYIRSNHEVEFALGELRRRILEKTGYATTNGYGPRFLHSTGQLHKGDAGKGLFIQITADDAIDIPIPTEAGSSETNISFGVLKTAQAQGDRQALLNAGRKVLRVHFSGDVPNGLTKVSSWIR